MTSSEDIIQFHNCDILRDHKIFREDLWVRDKKIINPEPIFFDEKVVADVKIDCGGALIAPGFIDLQINGGFGQDFSTNLTDVENGVITVAKGVLKYGVTSFCPTVITSSPKVYHQIIPNIRKQNGSKDGAGVLGIHVEGPFINKEKKGAHPVQYIRTLDCGFQDILDVYGSIENVTLLTLAPELDPQGLVIQELVKHGITVSLGHSTGSLTEGERAIKQGSTFITHLFNAMLPFHHRDPGLVGLLTSQKLPQDKTVFYGIIADGIHTHPAALRIAYRSNSKGLVLVTDAMSAMGLEPGNYCIGEQKVEVTGRKAVIAGTNILSGSIATMDVCVRYLSESTGCSVVGSLESATLHPAQVLNITESKGTLDFGTDADLVFLDKNLNVTKTYIAGECVWDKSWNTEEKYCA